MNCLKRCVLFLAAGVTGASHADTSLVRTPSEIKAVYTAYIARYTSWPGLEQDEKADTALNISVVGPDPNGVVDLLRGRIERTKGLLSKQRVRLVEFPSLAANSERQSVVSALDESHLLFLSADSEDEWEQLRPLLDGRPIMTVSELPGFARQGGIVEYEYDAEAQRMYMIVNMQALQAAGVALSATLLDLSIVKPLRVGD